MASQKCVHKGCGKVFTDPEESCVYHPGPPVFHEGQKGWKCCKPRVLTFDEFLAIRPCTTGKHSIVDDSPVPASTPNADDVVPSVPPVGAPSRVVNGSSTPVEAVAQPRVALPPRQAAPSPAPVESDSDDPSVPISSGLTCRRRGCNATYENGAGREDEKCVHHPGHPLFHEGSKGYTCCSRRVLEFDEFMRIEGCKTKTRHMFVGSGKRKQATQGGVEMLETVRNDFYQTSTSVIVSFYLKKIDPARAVIKFSSPVEIELDLPTTDQKRYQTTIPLYGLIDPETSSFKIMGTKLEMCLVKGDGSGWPHLRSDEKPTGEIIQVGQAARA